MPTARANGTSLYYEDVGAGPPLLFVHGTVTDASTWAGQVGRLSPEFRCIAYDRRGSSRSPLGGPADAVAGVDADDAAALIRLLGAAPCIVVASSAGGRIALELMERHRQLLAGAVLSEPAVFELDPGDHSTFDLAVRSAVQRGLATGGPRSAVEAFARVIDPVEWASATEEERDRRRDNHPAMLRILGSPPDPLTGRHLQAMQIPCTVVAGAETHDVFRRIAEVLAASIPGARLVEVAGSGHQTYAGRPEQFAQIVREFARSVFRPGEAVVSTHNR